MSFKWTGLRVRLIPSLQKNKQTKMRQSECLYKGNNGLFYSCHRFGWVCSLSLLCGYTSLQPASPAALFMSTNQDPSSRVLATLLVTSLPWPDPACFPTALARVYANACSLGLTTLGQSLLPELELGAFLTCSNQPRHPPSGVQRTATC